MSVGILTFQFSTDNSPSSDLIRYLTNGTVSHVDWVLPAGLPLPYPVGATSVGGELLGARLKGGVAVRPANYKTFSLKDILCVEVPDVEASYVFALDQLGLPYNRDAIIDMGFHRLRSFSINQKSWFCDELAYAIVLAGGVELLNTDNPLSLTPEEVMLSPYLKACA